MRPRHLAADRHRIGAPVFFDRHAADETVGRVHRDRSARSLAEVLRDLDDEVVRLVVIDGLRERSAVLDLGQLAGRTRRRRRGR